MPGSTERIIVLIAPGYSRLCSTVFGLKLTGSIDGAQQYAGAGCTMITPMTDPAEIMIRTAFVMGRQFGNPGPYQPQHREIVLMTESDSVQTISMANEVYRENHRRPFYPDILYGHSLDECRLHDECTEAFIRTVESYVPAHGIFVLALPPHSRSESSSGSTDWKKARNEELVAFRSFLDRRTDAYPPEVFLNEAELNAVSELCAAGRLHRNDRMLLHKAALARRVRTGSIPVRELMEQVQTLPASRQPRRVNRLIDILEQDVASY